MLEINSLRMASVVEKSGTAGHDESANLVRFHHRVQIAGSTFKRDGQFESWRGIRRLILRNHKHGLTN